MRLVTLDDVANDGGSELGLLSSQLCRVRCRDSLKMDVNAGLEQQGEAVLNTREQRRCWTRLKALLETEI